MTSLVAVVLLIASCGVALHLLGRMEPVYRIAATDPVWFVALKLEPATASARLVLAEGVQLRWDVHADFTLIGTEERYWDRFLVLAGAVPDAALPLEVGDAYADCYVVRLKLKVPPALVLGVLRVLHLLGLRSMPRGEVVVDPNDVGARLDAMPSKESIATLLSRPATHRPVMVNFLRYVPRARYSGSEASSSSGRQAYDRYGLVALETVYRTGGRLAFFGRIVEVRREAESGPTRGAWDDIGVMEYSEPKALLTMEQVPRYRAALLHRDAGLEKTILICSTRSES